MQLERAQGELKKSQEEVATTKSTLKELQDEKRTSKRDMEQLSREVVSVSHFLCALFLSLPNHYHVVIVYPCCGSVLATSAAGGGT